MELWRNFAGNVEEAHGEVYAKVFGVASILYAAKGVFSAAKNQQRNTSSNCEAVQLCANKPVHDVPEYGIVFKVGKVTTQESWASKYGIFQEQRFDVNFVPQCQSHFVVKRQCANIWTRAFDGFGIYESRWYQSFFGCK